MDASTLSDTSFSFCRVFSLSQSSNWIWRKILAEDKFCDLKNALMKAISVDQESFASFAVQINFVSCFRSKLPQQPLENQNVLVTLQTLEESWPGYVVLELVDLRERHLLSSDLTRFSFSPSPECTHWLPHQGRTMLESSTLESMVDKLFLSSKCHGALSKRIVLNGKQETWREEYFFLEENRLWFACFNNWESCPLLSFVDLEDNLLVSENPTIRHSFTITISDNIQLLLKGKCTAEIKMWMDNLKERGVVSKFDELMLNELESQVTNLEYSTAYLALSSSLEKSQNYRSNSQQDLLQQIEAFNKKSSQRVEDTVLRELLNISPCNLHQFDHLQPSSGFFGIGSRSNVEMVGIVRCKFTAPQVPESCVSFVSTTGYQINPSSVKVLDRLDELEPETVHPRGQSDSYFGTENDVPHLGILCNFACQGRIYVCDLDSSKLRVFVDLSTVCEVTVGSHVGTFELRDGCGGTWQFSIVPVDEEDGRQGILNWLKYIKKYLPHQCRFVQILRMGFLSKRGVVNTSFKKRWFVLTSDGMLRYYKDDFSGQLKGAIDLTQVDSLTQSLTEDSTSNFLWNKSSSGSVRELVLWTRGRLWILHAQSVSECNSWFEYLNNIRLQVENVVSKEIAPIEDFDDD